MPSAEYASVPSSGKLKLKGVKDSKVSKKKKKPKIDDKAGSGFEDRSVALKLLDDEEKKEEREKERVEKGKEVVKVDPIAGEEEVGEGEDDGPGRAKTEAEIRHDEQKRRRLDQRLKREGVKTHKERVEELNRYLSGLSEHHDMPRIGPG